MKKNIVYIFSLVLLLQASLVWSQNNLKGFGIKIGPNLSWTGDIPQNLDADGLRLGFVGGAYTQVNLEFLGFYFQPEVNISQTGSNFNTPALYRNTNTPVILTSNIRLTNLDIPLLLGHTIGSNEWAIRAQGGLVLTSVLSARERLRTRGEGIFESETIDIKEQINSFNFGYQLGAGINLAKITLDLKYQHSFTPLYKNQDNNKSKVSSLQITLGYFFSRE